MADLRFSNQGPIVLGLGGAYPNYASIPTVFGGPTQGIIISVYNRGGAYVPNTVYNQSVPTTISAGNPVDFSDYYTTSNYNPGPTPVPPIPNPRPVNPDNPPENPILVVVADVNLLTTGYINDTVNMGRLNTINGAGLISYTCSSVTINGITTPNVAVDPTNIQFVIQAEMNYDINNKADVLINIPSLQNGLNIANYFYRYPINYSVSGSISSTSGLAGDTITIDGLLSLQVDPYPTLTIGGVEQTISAISGSGNTSSLMFIVNADTPFTDSDIVITNNFGDSVTLSDQFKQLEVNPLPPSDRGPPPSLDWPSDEALPEHLQFTFSNNYQVPATNFPLIQSNTSTTKLQANNVTTDPDSEGHGNQSSVPFNTDFQYQLCSSQPGYSNLNSISQSRPMVNVGTVESDVFYPADSSGAKTLSVQFRAPNNRSFATTYIYGFTSDSGYFAGSGIPTPNASAITFSGAVNSFTFSISLANIGQPERLLLAAGTSIWLTMGYRINSSSSVITQTYYQDGSTVTYPINLYYYTTYKGYPIATTSVVGSTGGIMILKALTTIEPSTGDLCGVAQFSAFGGTASSPYYFGAIRFKESDLLSKAFYSTSFCNFVTKFPDTTTANLCFIDQNSNSSSTFSGTFLTPKSPDMGYINNPYMFKVVVGGKLFTSICGIPFNWTDNIRLVTQSVSILNNSFTNVSGVNLFYGLTKEGVIAGRFYNWNGSIGWLMLGNSNVVPSATELGPGGWIQINGSSTGIDRRQITSPNIFLLGNVIGKIRALNIYDDIVVSDAITSSTNIQNGVYCLNNSWNFIIAPQRQTQFGNTNYGIVSFQRLNNGYYINFLGSAATPSIYKTGPLLDAASPVSYTFTRPASTTYTAINLTINPLAGTTNLQKATSLFNSILAVWNKTPNPTATYTTDAMGGTVLDINTNQPVVSGSTFTLTTGTPTGTISFNSFGGTAGNASGGSSRLQISGAPSGGPIYIESDYGYINNLTFTHQSGNFTATSAVIPNVNQPSSIRDIITI